MRQDRRESFERQDQELRRHQEEHFEIVNLRFVRQRYDLAVARVDVARFKIADARVNRLAQDRIRREVEERHVCFLGHLFDG